MLFRSISAKSETGQGCLLPLFPFSIVPKVLVKAIEEKCERERDMDGRRNKIVDSYRYYDAYIENPIRIR